MQLEGGCHCGDVRYQVAGDPEHVALCHCTDCQKSSGAPVTAWAAFASVNFAVLSGTPTVYGSTDSVERNFCPRCGTGMWYINEAVLPGLVDIQVATLDDPAALPPQVNIQAAERIDWVPAIAELPTFERYPG